VPCVCLSLRNALERVRNAAYWGQRIQTAVLSCPAKRMSEVAIGMRAVQAYSSKCIGRVAVGGSGLDTRGPGPGSRRAGRQTGQAQKNGTLQLNCFGLHGLGKPVTATVRRDKEETTLLLATALLSTLRAGLLLPRVLSKLKTTDTPRQQHHAADSAKKKPGRLDKPRVHWPWEIAMGLGV
jgi:hypothetical protein